MYSLAAKIGAHQMERSRRGGAMGSGSWEGLRLLFYWILADFSLEIAIKVQFKKKKTQGNLWGSSMYPTLAFCNSEF